MKKLALCVLTLCALILFVLTGCNKASDYTLTESYDTTVFDSEAAASDEEDESKKEEIETEEGAEEGEEQSKNENENMEKVFNCDAQRLDAGMSDVEVTSLYQKACADGKENGYTPVIVFVDEILEETIEGAYEGEGGSELYINAMVSAEHSDGKELFDERYAELANIYGEEFLSVDNDALDMWLSIDGYGTDVLPAANTFEGEAYLLRVPTDKPYEIFAWLPFGGWNDCPDTDKMIAMCKYWYDEYGAMPAIITYDMLTFYLNEPITNRETAMLIAKEQCAFCSEVLGMGGMESYVAMTLGKSIWSFWWD